MGSPKTPKVPAAPKAPPPPALLEDPAVREARDRTRRFARQQAGRAGTILGGSLLDATSSVGAKTLLGGVT